MYACCHKDIGERVSAPSRAPSDASSSINEGMLALQEASPWDQIYDVNLVEWFYLMHVYAPIHMFHGMCDLWLGYESPNPERKAKKL